MGGTKIQSRERVSVSLQRMPCTRDTSFSLSFFLFLQVMLYSIYMYIDHAPIRVNLADNRDPYMYIDLIS